MAHEHYKCFRSVDVYVNTLAAEEMVNIICLNFQKAFSRALSESRLLWYM